MNITDVSKNGKSSKFVKKQEGKQVDILLDKAAVTMREENRYCIKTLIELIIFSGRQEIALHGHDERMNQKTEGIFRADRNY